MNFETTLLIFTDGACSGNPGPGGFGAIIAYPSGHIRELGQRSKSTTTNNRMEMTAVIQALKFIKKAPEAVWILTDSAYIIRGITQWIFGWKKRDWKTVEGTDVVNKDLWQQLDQEVSLRKKINTVEWKYVPAHIGIPGNERCDEIAVALTNRKNPHLYSGPLLNYPVAIHDLPEDMSLPPMKSRKKKPRAYSYLNYTNGRLQRYSTWRECEAAVKGRPRAKFKKSLSQQHEKEIIESWGLCPSALDKEN